MHNLPLTYNIYLTLPDSVLPPERSLQQGNFWMKLNTLVWKTSFGSGTHCMLSWMAVSALVLHWHPIPVTCLFQDALIPIV